MYLTRVKILQKVIGGGLLFLTHTVCTNAILLPSHFHSIVTIVFSQYTLQFQLHFTSSSLFQCVLYASDTDSIVCVVFREWFVHVSLWFAALSNLQFARFFPQRSYNEA